MSDYRNPIGFKVTDNKLVVMDHMEPPLPEELENLKLLLRIAHDIDREMRALAGCMVRHEPFSSQKGKRILEQLDKLYIKHYEPL
tara:strand:+ start:12272 stop:12526 length:255 start_codon:yes stop_codon:yes gene_type:complete